MLSLEIQCPAKVNLFLEVTGERQDGYHTLATLFSKINLFDVLRLEKTARQGIELTILNETGQALSSGPDNLICRAFKAFRKAFHIRLGVKAHLTKKIPLGAGLGGGSSDAAGALRALARLCRMDGARGLPARLKRLALELGADVPFFLSPFPCCEARGIGEKLSPIALPKSLPWMVLVFPGFPIPTKIVYERLKASPRQSVLTRLSHLDTLKKKLEKGRPISEWAPLLFNRLEEGVLAGYPEVHRAKSILCRLGLQGVLMSGSGSSVFGFASSQECGEQVVQRLKGYPWKVFLTFCLG